MDKCKVFMVHCTKRLHKLKTGEAGKVILLIYVHLRQMFYLTVICFRVIQLNII